MKYLFTTIFLLMMAAVSNESMAASISVNASASPSTTTINHPVGVSLAILNGTASQLTVTNVVLTATSTSNPTAARLPMAFSVWNQGPNSGVTIGPSATTTINGGTLIFFSPSTGITGSGTNTYSIGGTVYTSDGSVTPITVGGVAKINPIPLPAYERQ